MTPILIVAGLTLLASFLCSLFEAALYSITPSQLEVLKKGGGAGALKLAALRDDVEEPIAAILTINTIAHTIGSAVCGAMVAAEHGSGEAGQAGADQAVAIFAAVFTFLVLILTEIIPKSLGVRYAQTLGPMVATPIQWMVWISYPVAKPSKILMRMLTGGGNKEGPSEAEIVLFSKLALTAGGVRKDEHRWLKGALLLDQVTAGELRTPRTVVTTLDAAARVEDVTKDQQTWVHSRIPLTEDGNPDAVIGVVFRKDVFAAALVGGGGRTLRELMKPLAFVPETMPAHELMAEFIKQRRHMVAVADEYGGFEGVVTLEDVVEQLLGEEIVDEFDQHEDMQQAARDLAGDGA